MSDIEKKISLPLDEDGYFRRECPLCHKEFKILLSQEELTELAQEGINSYMLEQQQETDDSLEEEEDSCNTEYFCPYCEQKASNDNWWTQEQIAYVHVVAENIFANLMNENFIKPMKRNFGRGSIIRFDAKEMKQREAWISPENNAMGIVELPCCQKKIKIEEHRNNKVYCYFCGFPHDSK